MRPARPLPAAPVLLGSAFVLFAWGAWEAWDLTRLFHHGVHAHGVIVRADHERDDTRIHVAGAECPVTGDVGPVGRSVPVVHPHGRPIECVVRSPSAFRWSAGAMLLGGAIVLVFGYRARRDSRPR